MLSADIAFFIRHFRTMKSGKGEVHLSADTVKHVDLVLEELHFQALRLESARGQRRPILIDTSDPKIAVFPIVRRSIPVKEGDAS